MNICMYKHADWGALISHASLTYDKNREKGLVNNIPSACPCGMHMTSTNGIKIHTHTLHILYVQYATEYLACVLL